MHMAQLKTMKSIKKKIAGEKIRHEAVHCVFILYWLYKSTKTKEASGCWRAGGRVISGSYRSSFRNNGKFLISEGSRGHIIL